MLSLVGWGTILCIGIDFRRCEVTLGVMRWLALQVVGRVVATERVAFHADCVPCRLPPMIFCITAKNNTENIKGYRLSSTSLLFSFDSAALELEVHSHSLDPATLNFHRCAISSK